MSAPVISKNEISVLIDYSATLIAQARGKAPANPQSLQLAREIIQRLNQRLAVPSEEQNPTPVVVVRPKAVKRSLSGERIESDAKRAHVESREVSLIDSVVNQVGPILEQPLKPITPDPYLVFYRTDLSGVTPTISPEEFANNALNK